MKLLEAYSKIKKFGLPVLQTRDVSGILDIERSHASKLLQRMGEANLLLRLTRGLWGFPDRIDPLALPFYLTAPSPSYVSLQTALYHHGMISQIPDIIYAVSIARTRIYKTTIATVSIHRLSPDFFFGYEVHDDVRIASAEKALLDFLYLSPAKSRWFSALPELEFPESFDEKEARKMIHRIKSPSRRTVVLKQFEDLMGMHR